MTKANNSGGADWTQLLSDPELASHLGELLQAYREAAPEKRDEALLAAMRRIKNQTPETPVMEVPPPNAIAPEAQHAPQEMQQAVVPIAVESEASPPFEPDIFTPSWGEDRRRFPRLKCFVAVEIKVGGSTTPIWGNLANTSTGGCFVETAAPVPSGSSVEIGLWLANGKIWIKGIILTGIVTKTSPTFGVRVKFSDLEPSARETLRQFLRFVETTTRGHRSELAYLAELKR
jgi:PilZ domain